MTRPRTIVRSIPVALLLIAVPLSTAVDTHVGMPAAAVALHTVPTLQRNVLPGDFNGDGRIDLIGSGSLSFLGGGASAGLRIAFGRGDGTFVTRSLGLAAEPAAVADIDGDGRLDIVARSSQGVVVLRGLAGGTFASPLLVHAEEVNPSSEVHYQFALVADFSGNGRADIAVSTYAGSPGVRIYPGNGDFTFQPPMHLATASAPIGAAAGDFTGDGRPDLAVTGFCCGLTIFINQGGLLFTPTEIPLGGATSGVATGDLDGDGHLDLVVAEFFEMGIHQGTRDNSGTVAVLLGNGDGTFADKVQYNSGVRGETRVVLGDFTRDGVLDVATGNRSYLQHPDFYVQASDSVTIFRGTGTGALADPVTFALDYGGALFVPGPYAQALNHLATGDVDGDGHPDIITSPGAVLLTRAPVPNRPPVVSAGSDRTESMDTTLLHAHVSDPDHHWLTYEWSDHTGRVIAETPIVREPSGHSGLDPGRYTFTVIVEDGHGGTASDSVTVISVDPQLRSGTFTQDVGGASPAGSAVFGGTPERFTVTGAGADIWGTADAFQYLHHPIIGDFRIVTQVTSVEHAHRWTKAGLMVRESLAPGSRHASVFATPTAERPVAFQRRTATNGLSVHTDGAFVGPPVWLALTRLGDRLIAQYRVEETDAWTTIGTEALAGLPPEVLVGLAVSSHVEGRLATATFEALRIELIKGRDLIGQDIGDPGALGSGTFGGDAITVRGAGADIWGTADAFHFFHAPVTGDFEIVVRAASIDNVDRWTKAGLMVRESLHAGARHASVFATPTAERPVAFQRRPVTNGPSLHTAGALVGPPVWLSLTRVGDAVTARYRLSPAQDWVTLGTQVLADLPSQVFVGLAVSSHVEGVLATATFDGLLIGGP